MKEEDEYCEFCKRGFSDIRPPYPIGTGKAHSDCLGHALQRVGGHSIRQEDVVRTERLAAIRAYPGEEFPVAVITAADLEEK